MKPNLNISNSGKAEKIYMKYKIKIQSRNRYYTTISFPVYYYFLSIIFSQVPYKSATYFMIFKNFPSITQK